MPSPILIRESPRERDNPIASLVHVVSSDDGQAIRDFELWWVLHGRDLPINWWNRHKNLMRESVFLFNSKKNWHTHETDLIQGRCLLCRCRPWSRNSTRCVCFLGKIRKQFDRGPPRQATHLADT